MTHASLRAGVLGAVVTATLTLGAVPALALAPVAADAPRTLPIADPGIVQPAEGTIDEAAAEAPHTLPIADPGIVRPGRGAAHGTGATEVPRTLPIADPGIVQPAWGTTAAPHGTRVTGAPHVAVHSL
ncbi:hypothetical protein ACFV5N_21375, partial [Streptomyces sp. NPDC059853]